MNIYENSTGLFTPQGVPCNCYIINVVCDAYEEVDACEAWFWSDDVEVKTSVQPNQIRRLPVSAEGTQEEVESRVFDASPFDFDGETITLLNDNIVGTYP